MNVAYHILDKETGTILRSGVCTYETMPEFDPETEEFMEAPILDEPHNPVFQDPILTAQGIEYERLSAARMIDETAEIVRSRYITLGSGQAMVYQQKKLEAELVAADAGINPSLVPHIAYEAGLNQIPLLDQAAIVLTMAEQWKMVSAYIEMARLGAKAQIATLATVEDIRAFMTIDHFAGL
jgi:hypothetical protein